MLFLWEEVLDKYPKANWEQRLLALKDQFKRSFGVAE